MDMSTIKIVAMCHTCNNALAAEIMPSEKGEYILAIFQCEECLKKAVHDTLELSKDNTITERQIIFASL